MMKYNLDDKPSTGHLVLYGIQWWIVSMPCVVILGKVMAGIQYTSDAGLQVFYVQKLLALTGLVCLAQIIFGHRLPLVEGPASVLLVGTMSSLSSGFPAIYTATMTGGLALFLLSAFNLIEKLRSFFTPRMITVILILIALTLSPTILNLVVNSPHPPSSQMVFAAAMALIMILCNRFLPGILKSLTVAVGMVGGTVAHFLLFGVSSANHPAARRSLDLFIGGLDFQPGTMLSFLFCMIALAINQLSSMESVGLMLNADRMDERIRAGTATAGLGNVLAGLLGTIGPVSFSLSAGVINATGCASRFALLPAAAGLIVCGFVPPVARFLSLIPGAVMGSMMLYLMTAQMASGLSMMVSRKVFDDFNGAVCVAFSLMIGLLVSFVPQAAFSGFPGFLRSIVGNGFVVGTLSVIILERLILKPSASAP